MRTCTVFRDLRTQWRWTNGVMVGLDYNVLYTKLDRMAIAGEEAELVEMEIRVMESAVLELMNERREAQARKSKGRR